MHFFYAWYIIYIFLSRGLEKGGSETYNIQNRYEIEKITSLSKFTL